MWQVNRLGGICCVALVLGAGCDKQDDKSAKPRAAAPAKVGPGPKDVGEKAPRIGQTDIGTQTSKSVETQAKAPIPSTTVEVGAAPTESVTADSAASNADTNKVADGKSDPGLDGSAFDRLPPGVPKVLLTKAESKELRVGVGDAMPEFELTDSAGAKTTLAAHSGKRATVVVFWNDTSPYAAEELADLQPQVANRFGPRGANVVAVAIKNAAKPPTSDASAVKHPIVMLADASGDSVSKLAPSYLPLTYVLDAEGKIRWFDIEYSRSTRRELQAVLASLLSNK